MRKTVLLVLCCLSASFLYPQNIFLGGRSIDDYVGTWRYENKDSNLVFTIKLKKSEMTPNEKTYQCVVGTYAMTRNGVTVVDNMEFDILSNWFKYPISCVDFNEIYDKLSLGFVDDLYEKNTVSGTLSLIPLKDGKFNLQWILKEDEGDYVYDWNEVIPPSGFSVPDNIVLVKIE